MSAAVVELVRKIVGDAPGSPQFAQPFSGIAVGVQDFGDDVGGAIFDGITVNVGAGAKIQTPANGLLRYVPNLGALGAEHRAAFIARWPALRRLDGSVFDAAAQTEGNLLFEVWPTAFRRLEGMFASNEIPAPDADPTRPQMPVPRWFLFKGIPKAELQARVQTIANAQFPGAPPDIARFFTGEIPVYAPHRNTLADAIRTDVEIRAFDLTGLVIDPAVICGFFDELAQDLFGAFAAPGTTPFASFPQRHTVVFSGPRGQAYVPYGDPPPGGVVAPLPRVSFPPTLIQQDLAAPSLVRYRNGDGGQWGQLQNQPIVVTLDGEHTRVGLHPHGKHARAVSAAFGNWTFLRLRVTDLARWFPRNENALNDFARYTEQNDVIALADGQAMFRESYRAFRSTYVDETYASEDDLPAGAPRSAAEAGASQILMTNYSISPRNALLGMRALLSTPRTQPDAGIPDDPIAGATLIPLALAAAGEQRSWWLVSPRNALPPGSSVELQPIGVGASFAGDDPRIPGTDSGADLFGITIHSTRVVRVFVNGDGQFVLPVQYAPEWQRGAELRVITWEPHEDDADPLATTTSGKGTKIIHARGVITVPAPAGFAIDGVGAPWSAVLSFSVTRGAEPASAQLVVGGGTLAAPARVIVVNQRSGDTVVADVAGNLADEIAIALPNFGVDDVALVSAVAAGVDDAFNAPFFFAVSVSDAARAAGTIPSHPKELIGVLRQAISSGVEVRLLAWHDALKSIPESLKAFAGVNAALNAGAGGNRGEGIADPVLRETSAHHQKTAFIRSPAGVAAFIGGIDQTETRWAAGDHAPVDPDRPTMTQWHDIHCLVRGKAAWDIFRNFRQRWNVASIDPRVTADGIPFTPVDPLSLADINDPAITPVTGTHAVQINRTIPRRVQEYLGVVDPLFGDTSIRASYLRTMDTARELLYIEEQYFWNIDLARKLNERLRAADGLSSLILILPKELSELTVVDLILYAIRVRAINMLLYGKELLGPGEDGTVLPEYVGDRVLVAHLVNEQQEPVYVHCKTIIADDLWMSIGSSNLNRRSMNYDTELNAASIDARIARGGHVSARDMRVRLMSEHLGLAFKERSLVEQPRDAFLLMKDVLSGNRPWLDHHLAPYDPTFTHYGIQPVEYNQVFLEALDVILDSDGEALDLGIDLLSVVSFKAALEAADEAQAVAFGGLGTIRVTFDVAALAEVPAAMFVEVSRVGSAEPPVRVGPFQPALQPTVGIYAIGHDYEVRGEAFDANNVLLGAAGPVVVAAAGFVSNAVLMF